MKSLIFLFTTLLIINVAYPQWKISNGPGNAVLSAIYSDANELYVASGQGNFISTDNGDTWELLNKNGPLNQFTITTIAKKDNYIILGGHSGAYFSNDYGKKWDTINTGFNDEIFDLKKIFVCKEKIFALNSHDLYFFDDVEKKWTMILDTVLQKQYGGFQTIIQNENTLFLGTDTNKITKSNLLLSGDNGKTWRAIADTASGITNYGINCFAFMNNLIYVGTNRGVFISTNGGENFTAKNKDFNVKVTSIYVSDTILIFGTSMGLFNSLDNCETYNWITFGIGGNYITSIQLHNNRLIAGTLNGLYRSTNNGYTWEIFNEGLCGGSIFDITESNGKIYAATYGENIFITENKGLTWQNLKIKNSNSISRIAVKDSNIFAGLYGQGFYYSNNSGLNWNKITEANGLNNQRINYIQITDENIFVGTWQGIYISSDLGTSWNPLNYDMNYYRITSLFAKDDNLFAGTYKSGIFISTDKGENWTTYSTSFTQVSISDIKFINQIAFASTFNSHNVLNPTPSMGIFKSTDFGLSWNQTNTGLSEVPINCLTKFGNNIFVGTEGDGVFLSTDFGDSWIKVSIGLINNYVNQLLIYNDEIYAATAGGVFKATISDLITNVIEEEIEKKNYLWAYPPYPIPASNTVRSLVYWDTSIDIENDDIAVYDIYGTKVAGRDRITIDKQNAYSGILTWNCTNVPDGIYLIRIIHGTKTWTLKVIVSK